MATTRAILTPFSAEPPSSNFPGLTVVNGRPALAFDAVTQETTNWTFIAPQGLTGALSCVITYMMASAVSGNIEFEVAVEAITGGDATDLDATTSFDTVNSSGATAVPGTAGYIDQISVTLTNADAIAAGDLIRISISRDADDATNDTAAGDLYFLVAELREA